MLLPQMRPYSEKISVIIPVYNQEATIKENILSLKRKLNYIGLNREFEFIVIDDGSDDGTWERVAELRHDDICVYGNAYNEGKGAAFKAAYEHATGDYIMLIDSDAQIDCEDLYTFFNIMLLYRADAVVGNKRHEYSNVRYSLPRWIVSNVYSCLCRTLFGIRLRDTQCGMKLFKRKAIARAMDRVLVKRFAFDLELIVALREQGVRIADAPVCVREQQGSGSVNIGNIIYTLKDTLAVWWRKKKGWYK